MKVLPYATAVLSLVLLPGVSFRAHASAPAAPPAAQDRDDMPPTYNDDVARRGFHDGMETARSDWQAQRTMDPYHTPAFRRPPVGREERQEYRSAFLRGYDAAMHRSRGWGWHDNNGWHDEHDNWRQNHENWENDPYDRGNNNGEYNPNYPRNNNPNNPNYNNPNYNNPNYNNPNGNYPRPYNEPH